jgi:hypothetical protein
MPMGWISHPQIYAKGVAKRPPDHFGGGWGCLTTSMALEVVWPKGDLATHWLFFFFFFFFSFFKIIFIKGIFIIIAILGVVGVV